MTKLMRARIAQLKSDAAYNIACIKRAEPHFQAAEAAAALIAPAYEPRVSGWLAWDDAVTLNVTTDTFKGIDSILELFMNNGYEFDRTEDYAAGSTRTYKSKGIHVCAKLRADKAAGCERVIVRYETPEPRPVYEFKCDEGYVTPAAEAQGRNPGEGMV